HPVPDLKLKILTGALQEGHRDKVLQMARLGSAFVCSGESITAEEAGRLYGNHFSGSVSRMDSFSACPFSHFLQYGLCLKEREMFAVRAADTGLLFHDALDRFGEAMSHDGPYDWRTVSDSQASALVHDCVELSAQVLFQGLFSDTARNRYAAARVEDMLQTMIWGMLRQVRSGEMTPAFFETVFNEDNVTGKIDRIDVCERDGQVYTAVIDYKSGTASFDLGHIYDGRSLQLPVYLGKAQQFLHKRFPGKNIVPAGIFYDHIIQPVVRLGADEQPDQEDLERRMLKQMQLDGILNMEPDAQRTFAEDEDVRGLIVPVPKYNKDGSLSRNSPPAATERQLYGIVSFAEKKMEEQRLQIYEGVIRARPYLDGKKMTCDYCPFRSVCSFDLRLPGAACRFRTGLDSMTILQMMGEEDESGE
ncbi:MAG: PD-(D/E)XK nuclease family protein, partial [Lachnospiraceae bacterium]|nr:PD-(D/E)XK nuclease family protein [Lachnospiraceae bacterium]